MDIEVEKTYGNRVRIRVCGLCWNEKELLLVNHSLKNEDFWAPPGGGVEFGETLEQALIREFMEETGLEITVGKFLFGFEFIHKPLHGIELYFQVHRTGGKLIVGTDPELAIIQNVAYLDTFTVYNKPTHQRHGIFNITSSLDEVRQLNGFYRS